MEEQKPITHIVPTVGRVVWYWPGDNGDASDQGMAGYGGDQPFRADICHVLADGRVNLAVNDANGVHWRRVGVLLHQGDAEGCSLPRPFATWMPYQKAMAAKAEAPAPRIHSEQVLWDPELGQLWPALDLQRELLAEQVRELRLRNDAQETANRNAAS